jgi:sulfite reductase beta subunit-like hemoprotein
MTTPSERKRPTPGAVPKEAAVEIAEIAEAVRDLLAGTLPPAEFRRRRVINGIYPVRGGADLYLLRVRIPLGRPSPPDLETIADVADRFTPGGPIHLTTRQDVHIYGVQLREIPEALSVLSAGGLTTREACGDTVRNIVVCPFAGIARDEVFDVAPVAEELGRLLLRNPLDRNLPRKFKIAFEGCASGDHVGLGYHDVGARAALSPDGAPGFRLFLAGGLGALPRAGFELEPFTPAADLGATVEAVLRLFDRIGDRQRRGRARLKFVAEALGPDAFREAVLSDRALVAASSSGRRLFLPEPEPLPIGAVHRARSGFAWAGVIAQRQEGLAALPVRVPLAELAPDILRRLARLSEDAGAQVRLTPEQGLLLANVPFGDVSRTARELAGMGLFPPAEVALTRCAGADTCTIGTTRVRGLASLLETEILAHRERSGGAEAAVSLRISGCANGCGRHMIADIGLQGTGRKIGGRLAPHYTLYLGGGADGNGAAPFGIPLGRIPVRRVPDAVRRVLALCRAERTDGEATGDTIRRLGPAPFAEALKDLFEPSPESFLDADFSDLGTVGPAPFPPDRSVPKAP